jgi:hypothetical protein
MKNQRLVEVIKAISATGPFHVCEIDTLTNVKLKFKDNPLAGMVKKRTVGAVVGIVVGDVTGNVEFLKFCTENHASNQVYSELAWGNRVKDCPSLVHHGDKIYLHAIRSVKGEETYLVNGVVTRPQEIVGLTRNNDEVHVSKSASNRVYSSESILEIRVANTIYS